MVKAKAPRNKTLELSPKEIALYASKAVKLSQKSNLTDVINRVIRQDSFKALDLLPDGCIDLMIVDPPYNLTKNFGKSTFKEMDFDAYKKWLDKWLKKTVRLLKDNASIYICADWKTSICIPEAAGKYFILRNRISWEEKKAGEPKTTGKTVWKTSGFLPRERTIPLTLTPLRFRDPSLRLIATKKGTQGLAGKKEKQRFRLTHPSNIWTDISIPFWSMPENTPHPTQKPEKLIAKLILASSNEGDVVFDPFLGSGTTAVTAKKLGRCYIGIEQEKEYVALACKRLEMADSNREIQGFENGCFKARNC